MQTQLKCGVSITQVTPTDTIEGDRLSRGKLTYTLPPVLTYTGGFTLERKAAIDWFKFWRDKLNNDAHQGIAYSINETSGILTNDTYPNNGLIRAITSIINTGRIQFPLIEPFYFAQIANLLLDNPTSAPVHTELADFALVNGQLLLTTINFDSYPYDKSNGLANNTILNESLLKIAEKLGINFQNLPRIMKLFLSSNESAPGQERVLQEQTLTAKQKWNELIQQRYIFYKALAANNNAQEYVLVDDVDWEISNEVNVIARHGKIQQVRTFKISSEDTDLYFHWDTHKPLLANFAEENVTPFVVK